MAIICATDFSPCSRAAARVAAGLARRKGEPLVLVHVDPPAPADLTMMVAMVEGMTEEVQARLTADLEAEAREIGRAGVPVQTRIANGVPSEVLLDLTHSPDTSLLVMGLRGLGGGARLLVGSCAETVVRSAGCPVLVVPEGTTQLESWQSQRPLRLLLGADGSQATRALFYWARTSAPASPRDMSIVRLYWPPQEGTRYGIEPPWHDDTGSPELLSLLARDTRRDAAALSTDHEVDVRLQVLVRNGGGELAETARVAGVDALAVGIPRHRSKHWTPIETKALLRSASVPVFCIPEGIEPAEHHIPRYRTVLIASDLSGLAHEAILPAYGLLSGGGRVELCYVRHLPLPALDDRGETTPPLSDERRAALVSALENQIPAEAAERGISTHVRVLDGPSVPTAILQEAERIDADAIALASHGRSGIGRWLLGSVAEEVARRSSRPLLMIHAKAGDGGL